MSNNFSNALARNVGTSSTMLYEPTVGSKSMCIELDLCNTVTTGVTASVWVSRNGDDYYIVKDAPLPVGGSLQVISGQKIVLLDGDQLYLTASMNSSVDAIASILEDVV